jgi:hypothetical protein
MCSWPAFLWASILVSIFASCHSISISCTPNSNNSMNPTTHVLTVVSTAAESNTIRAANFWHQICRMYEAATTSWHRIYHVYKAVTTSDTKYVTCIGVRVTKWWTGTSSDDWIY